MRDASVGSAEQAVFIDRVLMFTDIEDSSGRWDTEPESMGALMRHHDALVSSVVERFGGVIGARTGDGAIALFRSAAEAARSALELQSLMGEGPAASDISAAPLRVRVGLHRGVVERRDGEHYGPPMHRAARVMAAGHGGQILLSAIVADELRAAMAVDPSIEMTIVSRGIQRLKGFHEPERLSELSRHAAPLDGRGLRGVAVIGNLPPIDLDAIIGRNIELGRICPEIRAGSITTLVGTGGVGKTRLALQIAALVQEDFHDGVWFVDLAAVSSPDRVTTAVADTIGVAEESSQPLISSLRQAMHTRQMLVVLDNCEHVFGAVTALMRASCSDRMTTSILATSQRELGVEGERVERVAPLECDPVQGAGLDDSPAAGMFVHAAQRGDPTFHPTTADHTGIGRICRRLDGLPLALELAAARVRVMNVAEIADQLETSFELLRSRDGTERHRTMSAAISWSVELLSPQDRSLLVDLAVFNGDFGWEGATAVSRLDRFDVADSLDELTRRSLLVRRGEALRMLVPLRLFCRAELAASTREPEVRARHAQWVLDSIPVPFDHADPHVVAARLAQLMGAADDLDAAHRWLVEHRVTDAVELSVELFDAHIARARYSVALDRARDCDVDSTPVAHRLKALGVIAQYSWMVGRFEDGVKAAERALEMAREHGLALPLTAAVMACAYSTPEAAAALIDPIERQIRSDDPTRQRIDKAREFPPLGTVIAITGDVERAVSLADEGVAAGREIGALHLLNALGMRIMVDPGSDDTAAMMPEIAALAQTVGRKATLAQVYLAMAHRARRAGDIAGFLSGVVQMAELVADDDPPVIVQVLHFVPASVIDRFPREAALMTAALDTLGVQRHIGAEKQQARRAMLREQIGAVLGQDELERAWAEGSQLGLAQVLDRLRWMAEAYSA